jgi:hypothetical protein
VDLYIIFEDVCDSIDKNEHRAEKKMVSQGFIGKADLDRLTQTANYYRHAHTRNTLPPNPPSIDEARALTHRMLDRWLEWKLSEAGVTS